MPMVSLNSHNLLAKINNKISIFVVFLILSLIILCYQLSFWQTDYIDHVMIISRIENYNLYAAFIVILLDIEIFYNSKFPTSKINLSRYISNIIQIPSVILASIYVATLLSLLNEIFCNGIFGFGYIAFYMVFMCLISVLFQIAISTINFLIKKHNTKLGHNLQSY